MSDYLRDPQLKLADPNSRKAAHCCPHCKNLLREAHQTEEGVRLCKNCLFEIQSMPGGVCSECSVAVVEGQYYPDKAAQREVNQLIVVCPFKSMGCPWTGKVMEHDGHVKGCQYKGVVCPNAGCGEMVLAGELDSHISECGYRIVKCVYCGKDMVAKELEGHHSNDCELHPVTCDRCQEEVTQRKQLADHHLHQCKFEECLICHSMVDRKTSKNASTTDSSHTCTDKTVIDETAKSNKDKESGTTTKLQQTPKSGAAKKSGPQSGRKQKRKTEKPTAAEELAASDDSSEEGEVGKHHLSQPKVVFRHIQSLASKHGELRNEFKTFSDNTETRLGQMEGTGRSHGDSEGLADSVRDIIRKMDEKLQSVREEAEKERNLRKELEEKLDQLKRDLQAAERKAKDALQKAEKNNRDIDDVRRTSESKTGYTGFGGGRGKGGKGGGWEGGGSVEERVMMLEQRTEQQERETSTLKVNVSELELQLQASLASTHNGSFLWRIPEVARRRRDAIDERITSIYSPPFYTGRNGYKMCIRAYLNGDGIGYKTHFSVFFVLMKGEFDPLLKWPFEYKVSLILVDQEHRKHIVQTFKPTPESSSFRRPQSDMNVASGCPQFSKLSVLDDPSYTKDDVIYLKCIVDTSRIFHP